MLSWLEAGGLLYSAGSLLRSASSDPTCPAEEHDSTLLFISPLVVCQPHHKSRDVVVQVVVKANNKMGAWLLHSS